MRIRTNLQGQINEIMLMFQGKFINSNNKRINDYHIYYYLSLITDLPLQTVANLNNYIIRNIIRQEQEPESNLHIVSSNPPPVTYRSSCLREPTTHLILTRKNNMFATSTDIPPVNDLITSAPECDRCFRKSKSYIDSLKYELSKRIEFEANRGNLLKLFFFLYLRRFKILIN